MTPLRRQFRFYADTMFGSALFGLLLIASFLLTFFG